MFGDLFAPVICLNFLDNKCNVGNKQCKDVHAKYPFLWQSELIGEWHNLPDQYCLELEHAFRLGEVYENQSRVANFDTMTIEYGTTSIQIRRLSTISSVLSNHKMATEFEWHFKGERNHWVKYGLLIGSVSGPIVAPTTSDDIEKVFCQINNKQRQMNTAAGRKQQYLLDFDNMTQMNKQTKVVTPIRRRVNISPLQCGSGPASDYSTAPIPAVEIKASTTGTNVFTASAATNAVVTASATNLVTTLSATNATATPTAIKVAVTSSATNVIKKTHATNVGATIPSATNVITTVQASPAVVHKWQFQDENRSWIDYGQPNSINSLDCVTTTTSDDIEKHFSKNPTQTLDISSRNNQYVLDFQNMIQTNKGTLVQRKMRRHLQNNTPVSTAIIDAEQYEWFFVDENNSLVKYGETNNVNDASFATTTTSKNIEAHFARNPNIPLDIQSNKNHYMIDVTKMTQKNKKTNVERKVFRKKVEYEWFFTDENNLLIKYGQTNKANSTDFATSVTSKDVEAHFVKNPDVSLDIQSKNNRYTIDFTTMTQRNRKTNVMRKVCRKCKTHSTAGTTATSTMMTATSTNRAKATSTNRATATSTNRATATSTTTATATSTTTATATSTTTATATSTTTATATSTTTATATSTTTATGTTTTTATATAATPEEYEWFFTDENNYLIKYGETNNANDANFATTTTSSDIEAHFVQTPTIPLYIQSNKNNYTIDFTKMTQQNKQTNFERKVHRKPTTQTGQHQSNTGAPPGAFTESFASVPSHWKTMTKGDGVATTVSLSPFTQEYKNQIALIRQNLPNFQATKVERIQNPFLWNAYTNRKEYMKQKYPMTNFREELLFHGTDAVHIDAICDENLDWRLHGTHKGQAQGQGTYLSNNASLSSSYCTSPIKVIFIVRVLIGKIAAGDSNTVKPPPNFDTTVDSVSSPSIFVKYDSQEYYPEYCVQF